MGIREGKDTGDQQENVARKEDAVMNQILIVTILNPVMRVPKAVQILNLHLTSALPVKMIDDDVKESHLGEARENI